MHTMYYDIIDYSNIDHPMGLSFPMNAFINMQFAKRQYTLEEEHAGEYYVQNQAQISTYKALGHIEHNCLLDIDSEPYLIRNTGIICTIGKLWSSQQNIFHYSCTTAAACMCWLAAIT